MASKNWAHLGTDGTWSDGTNWDPQGVPGLADTVELGTLGGSYTVTLDTAASVASVTVDAGFTTLLITSGHSLTTSGGIDLGANSFLSGAGTVTASGGISGSGTLEALGGTLDVSGTIDSGVVLAIDTAAAATLKIEGTATSADAISLNNDLQTLEIGSAGNLTISTHQDITGGNIILDGGSLTDMNGITLDGSATLSGYGKVITGTDSAEGGNGFFATYTPTIIASGGTLEFTGTANLYTGGNTQLIINTTPGSTVKFDGLARSNAPVINNSNQTLEIGSAGNLTLHGDPYATNGQIKLDGGTLNDDFGLTIGDGATLIGFGVVDTSGAINAATQGTGTIIASGGILEFKADVDVYTANAFNIADGATLKFDSAVGTPTLNPTITFDSAHGTLDLSGMNNEATNFNAYVNGFQAGDQIKITEGGTGAEFVQFVICRRLHDGDI